MSTSFRCPHYRFLVTTQTPRTFYEQFFGRAASLREWCEHPDSTFPKDGEQGKLPCGGNLEKCTLVSEAEESA
jgi:hypothetical protein